MAMQGEGKAKVCYTVLALSDLAVSGSLPDARQLAFYRYFPKPLQRSHLSLPPGDSALDLVGQASLEIPDWIGRSMPGAIGIVVPAVYVPSGVQVACGSSGPGRSPLECKLVSLLERLSVLPYAY